MKPRPCCDRRGFEGWTVLDYYSIMQLELCGFWARKANSTMFHMFIQSVLFEFNRLLTQILNTAVSSSWHHYSSSDVFTKSPKVNSKIFPRHQPISHGNRWIDHNRAHVFRTVVVLKPKSCPKGCGGDRTTSLIYANASPHDDDDDDAGLLIGARPSLHLHLPPWSWRCSHYIFPRSAQVDTDDRFPGGRDCSGDEWPDKDR